MYSLPKSGALPAVSQLIGKITRPILPSASLAPEVVSLKPSQHDKKSTYSLHKLAPKSAVSISNNWCRPQQVRYSHTDINFPDYSSYKRSPSKDVNISQVQTEPQRKLFSYLMVGGGALAGTYVAKSFVQDLMGVIDVSADILALAKVEVDLADVPVGENLTVKWRGKPVFIRHRTEEEIETEAGVDLASLRDPQHDLDRTQKPEWAVMLGVCTHLGCVPVPMAGDYNGYFCPCHGSHYDLSGRIRKGPAPLNLDIPDHSFPEGTMLVIG
ncbi:cytochrome b-c1 complex subunit Rieske, mitochondrial-like [Mytilus californianus]|uniref:cytochrome b-c1 complex subunit Rieske, mitochondrial-like n=1 Tax=Mytilus californianus TaxID=6549 RepID=UPI002247F16F|nr:cytochrome b-c1 complex subunit Rieske, mitochondrial-like [Mytilus californianus]